MTHKYYQTATVGAKGMAETNFYEGICSQKVKGPYPLRTVIGPRSHPKQHQFRLYFRNSIQRTSGLGWDKKKTLEATRDIVMNTKKGFR